jgi:hypothetical protein
MGNEPPEVEAEPLKVSPSTVTETDTEPPWGEFTVNERVVPSKETDWRDCSSP